VSKTWGLLALGALFFSPLASAAEKKVDIDAVTLAKRVGQVFAGYEDFWVWVQQESYDDEGRKEDLPRIGRAYFKRDKCFRLNFDQPPVRIDATDGKEYWIYLRKAKEIRFWELDEHTPVHPLLPVFAMGDRMAKALKEYFDVDKLTLAKCEYEDKSKGRITIDAYKLVVTLKPEKLKEMRKKAGLKRLLPDKKQTWTFWVEKKTWLPKKIRLDWETGRRSIYQFNSRFHYNIPLTKGLFQRPRPRGVTQVQMSKDD